MSREYPDWVDPWKAAEGGRTFAGSMPMNRMTRLLPLLAPPAGEAHFSARFGFDDQARVVIRIEVDAELPLICQRSLERYLEPVHRETLLGVIATLAEEVLLPGNYEPVLAEHGRLALQDLVEDELLLGVPQVPRNPAIAEVRLTLTDPQAEEREEQGAPPARKPFAGLAEQMKKRARDRDKDR
jgi:uncharacterized protein